MNNTSTNIALTGYIDVVLPKQKFWIFYSNAMDPTTLDILQPLKRYQKFFKQDSGGQPCFVMLMHSQHNTTDRCQRRGKISKTHEMDNINLFQMYESLIAGGQTSRVLSLPRTGTSTSQLLLIMYPNGSKQQLPQQMMHLQLACFSRALFSEIWSSSISHK